MVVLGAGGCLGGTPGWAGAGWAVLTPGMGGVSVGGTLLLDRWEDTWALGKYLPPGWAGVVWVHECLASTHLWPGWGAGWVVLTSGLGGHCLGMWVFGWYLPQGWMGGTYLWAGWVLGRQYLPLGWVAAGWAVLTSGLAGWAVLTSGLGGCWVGSTFLWARWVLGGRYLPLGWVGAWWGGQYLPLGWMGGTLFPGSVDAGWAVLTSGLGGCLVGSTYLWAGWVVLTSGLAGCWVGSTYLWAGWVLGGWEVVWVFGQYLPRDWAGVAWAVLTSGLGGLWLGVRLLSGRYSPLGWAVSDWVVLTSGLGGLWVGGPPSRCIHLCALICDREYRRFGSTTNIRRIRCSHSTKQDRS